MKSNETNEKILLDHLAKFITVQRLELFHKVIKNRTRHLTVVLEDIFQPHNASAVLRTCDCFGVQDVHIIENNNPYEVNPDVALGASKWLSMFKYNETRDNTLAAYSQLKDKGYRIIATTPHEFDTTMEELPLDQKTALVFGTELTGLSPKAIEHADGYVKINMYGFTESFNISVSAAILLSHLTSRLRKTQINWMLDKQAQNEVILQWMRNSIKRSDLIEREFLKNS